LTRDIVPFFGMPFGQDFFFFFDVISMAALARRRAVGPFSWFLRRPGPQSRSARSETRIAGGRGGGAARRNRVEGGARAGGRGAPGGVADEVLLALRREAAAEQRAHEGLARRVRELVRIEVLLLLARVATPARPR
jgi:hypothetical protein